MFVRAASFPSTWLAWRVEAWIWGFWAVGWSEAESVADVLQRRRPGRIEDEEGFVDGAVVVVAEQMVVLLQEGFGGSEVRGGNPAHRPVDLLLVDGCPCWQVCTGGSLPQLVEPDSAGVADCAREPPDVKEQHRIRGAEFVDGRVNP